MSVEQVTAAKVEDFLSVPGVAVLDFWAAWCRPCAQFSPVFERVSHEFSGVRFGTVNTDMEQDLARRFMVQSLPTVVVLLDGEVLFRRAGVMTARELRQVVDRFVQLRSAGWESAR